MFVCVAPFLLILVVKASFLVLWPCAVVTTVLCPRNQCWLRTRKKMMFMRGNIGTTLQYLAPLWWKDYTVMSCWVGNVSYSFLEKWATYWTYEGKLAWMVLMTIWMTILHDFQNIQNTRTTRKQFNYRTLNKETETKQKKNHHVKLLNCLFCYHPFYSSGILRIKVSLGSQLVQCVFIFFTCCALICGSCCRFGPKWNVNSLCRNVKSFPKFL